MSKQELYQHDLTDAQWFKAQASNPNGNCVEVAWINDGVAVRDSKNPDRPELRFTRDEWVSFLAGANLGEFNLL